MTTFNTPLNDSNQEYLLKMSQWENDDLNFIIQSSYCFDEPYMQISNLQATILQSLIRMNNITNVLEIGTFVGYSSLCMAKALLETKKSKLTSIEIKMDYHNIA